MKKIYIITLLFVFFLHYNIGFSKKNILHLNILEPGQPQLNITVIPPIFLEPKEDYDNSTKELVNKFYHIFLNNLSYLPFLNLINPDELVGGKKINGVTLRDIDFKKFALNKIDFLITIGWKIIEKQNIKIEVRTFDVYTPSLYLGRGYIINKVVHTYLAANKFCAGFMKKLTGKSGFFQSKIAFVKRLKDGSKNLFISTPQGYLPKQVTFLKNIVLSPAWSWDGKKLVFTYLSNNQHKLLLWSEGHIKNIFIPGNTIISPNFTPKGEIVVSSDMKGNPDIYLLDEKFKIKKALISSWAIDISPSFDKRGDRMAYVSSIYGNPNIFLYDFKNKKTVRVSYIGKYNTNPCISSNGKYIVYSTLTEKGHRIVLANLKTFEEKIITNGPGNDEHPVFGPDNYFIAFTSNRSGIYKIYITTKDGTKPMLVNTGDGEATSVAWSKTYF
ncbi:Tol-Pal system beta propeller repeat protein TolB [Desulfothermus naphthae]